MISRNNTFILRPFRLAAMAMLLACFLSHCGGDAGEQRSIAAPGTPVRVIHPTHADLTAYVTMNANTVFLRKETVRASFQGFVAEIRKNIGDPVSANDILLTMRTREAAADDSLAAHLGDASFDGTIAVHAHSTGILTSLDFTTGDFVNEGDRMAEIADPSSMRIRLNAPFQFAAALKRGAQCLLQLPDGRRLTATVDRSLPSVDPVSQTQTVLLRARIPGFLPEHLNLQARVPLRTEQQALVVPRSAVMCNEMQTQFWIMRVVQDTLAVRVNIRQGLEEDSLVQILEPAIDTTARVITEGAYGLADSSRIVITP